MGLILKAIEITQFYLIPSHFGMVIPEFMYRHFLMSPFLPKHKTI
jgi:hypothetical protein